MFLYILGFHLANSTLFCDVTVVFKTGPEHQQVSQLLRMNNTEGTKELYQSNFKKLFHLFNNHTISKKASRC